MDALYKIFDRFSEMIPPQLLPVIRLAAILVWVLLAGVVAVLAWRQGSESAPQMGQELSLAEIKARQQREANLKKPQNVRIPDLNELIPERSRDPIQYESPTLDARRADQERGLLESDGELIEPRNPVNDPLYEGEGLAPRGARNATEPRMLPVGPQDYRPARDAGVGGVRDAAGGNSSGSGTGTGDADLQPLDPGVGLDGRPLSTQRSQSADRSNSSRADTQNAPKDATRNATRSPTPVPERRRSTRESGESSGDLPLLD